MPTTSGVTPRTAYAWSSAPSAPDPTSARLVRRHLERLRGLEDHRTERQGGQQPRAAPTTGEARLPGRRGREHLGADE